jgi:hypothetical protein
MINKIKNLFNKRKNFNILITITTIATIYILLFNLHPKTNPSELLKPLKCLKPVSPSNQYYAIIDGIKYPKHVRLSLNKSINFDCIKQEFENTISPAKKRILAWNNFFTYADYDPFELNDRNCPLECELTSNISLVNQSDAVLVHMKKYPGHDHITIRPLPHFRPANQQWIAIVYESPVHIILNYSEFRGVFNRTMGYSSEDDDFPGIYDARSTMEWEANDRFIESRDFTANKTKFAFAVITICPSNSRRETFIEGMKRFVSVDVYGGCGKRCLVEGDKWNGVRCKEEMSKHYLFYLAFENSICRKYITEKFFVILKYDVVPVVFGGGDYDFYVGVF